MAAVEPAVVSPPPRRRPGVSGGLVVHLAWRFLRGRRSRLLNGTARAALWAIGLGVAAMVVAMALMSGYRNDLQRKLVSGNAGVTAYPLGWPPPAPEPGEVEAIQALPGVEEVRPVAYAQGSLASAAEPDGNEVTFRGVDPERPVFGRDGSVLRPDVEGIPGALLGEDLAEALEVRPGDPLRLMILGFPDSRPVFRYHTVRHAGTFRTGFAEFDASLVVLPRQLVARLTGESASHLYEVVVTDLMEAPRVAAEVEELLGEGFLVSDWQDLNQELFAALRLQQIALFLVLGLIVLVSTFNVASTLVVLVRERMREIGALAALGLSPRGLRLVFLLYGGFLGLAGTLAGMGAGSLVAWTLTELKLIRFSPEVAAIYFLSSVPFQVRPSDLLAVGGFALGVTLVACWSPARRAARVNPSAALRYE